MSTRCSLLYAGDKVTDYDSVDGAVEPYTHIWEDCMDDLVYVQVEADQLETRLLKKPDGSSVTVVTLTLPKWTSVAVKRALESRGSR